jgi:hypothetical protein
MRDHMEKSKARRHGKDARVMYLFDTQGIWLYTRNWLTSTG